MNGPGNQHGGTALLVAVAVAVVAVVVAALLALGPPAADGLEGAPAGTTPWTAALAP